MPSIAIRSASQLMRLFEGAGRRNQFSRHAFEWLYDYLGQLEEDTGAPVEIDVIGLCCDYTEEDFGSIAQYYGITLPERDEDESEEDYTEALREAILDYLRDNTVVLGYDEDSVLFAAF